jgi:hypothetical protein
MGAKGGFSKAFCGVYTDFQHALEKAFISRVALEILFHTAARGFRENCENTKPFFLEVTYILTFNFNLQMIHKNIKNY